MSLYQPFPGREACRKVPWKCFRENRVKNPAVFLLCNGFRRRDIINISEGTSHHLTGSREHLLCTLTALCTCAVAAQSKNFPFHRSGKKKKKGERKEERGEKINSRLHYCPQRMPPAFARLILACVWLYLELLHHPGCCRRRAPPPAPAQVSWRLITAEAAWGTQLDFDPNFKTERSETACAARGRGAGALQQHHVGV